MGKSARTKTFSSCQLRSAPYLIPCSHQSNGDNKNQTSTAREKYSWEDAVCAVCMESPHNAVLLLCSSYDKGCRPYICATDFRHSNCLDQFRKANINPRSSEKLGAPKLACPLCRAEVKGCALVEPAREHLNNKGRSCMQDGCSYVGTYEELCRHVSCKHPSAKPREVDRAHAYQWAMLQLECALQDMICLARSAMSRQLSSGLPRHHSENGAPGENADAGDETATDTPQMR